MSHAFTAEIPTGPVVIPNIVTTLAGNDTITPIWRNRLGGLTFRLGNKHAGIRYVKWVALGTPEVDLLAEAERLTWAGQWVNVPRVIDYGQDISGTWLVTAAISAVSAVEHRWIADPVTATIAIGRGLRLLHDALPVEQCRFTWSIEQRIAYAAERISVGEGPANWAPEYRPLGVATAWKLLSKTPSIDRLVVCHGDACVPNTLLNNDGTFAAHVDLGSLGVADRWADLAVAAWSVEQNYGSDLTNIIYDAYGIKPDIERISYYRLLWELA